MQQSAGDMLPCGGGVVLQLMASPVHLRGLGWSPPPPDNQLLLRSESRSGTESAHVQQWALDMLNKLVTWFFVTSHIYTCRKVLLLKVMNKSAYKVLKHYVTFLS